MLQYFHIYKFWKSVFKKSHDHQGGVLVFLESLSQGYEVLYSVGEKDPDRKDEICE
jgi:hypothetical protein